MTNEELREQLLAAPKNGYTRITAEQRAEMESYCKGYMAFIDACKTEREATAWTVAEAEKRGFKPAVPGMSVKPGDKIYLNNRDKSILLAVIGGSIGAWLGLQVWRHKTQHKKFFIGIPMILTLQVIATIYILTLIA